MPDDEAKEVSHDVGFIEREMDMHTLFDVRGSPLLVQCILALILGKKFTFNFRSFSMTEENGVTPEVTEEKRPP